MKISVRLFSCISFAVILMGCAETKYLTREESLKLRNEQIEATTKTYDAVTKEDVLIAVDKLFRLADGDDFQITHTENSIFGKRRWTIYLVLAASMGVDNWIVSAEDEKGLKTVKVTVRVQTSASSITPMMTTAGTNNWSVATLPPIEDSIQGRALYYIFFSRLDYLLGKSTKWLNCDEAEADIKEKKIKGFTDALCNSFNMKDISPIDLQAEK